MVGQSQNVPEIVIDQDNRIITLNGLLCKADGSNPLLAENIVTMFVAIPTIFMPIGAISLNVKPMLWQVEIQDIATDVIFLLKGDAEASQRNADCFFNTGLSLMQMGTLAGAETRCQCFRAIAFKYLAACFTRKLLPITTSQVKAVLRTVSFLHGFGWRGGELRKTIDASLVCRSLLSNGLTSGRTITRHLGLAGHLQIWLSAFLAEYRYARAGAFDSALPRTECGLVLTTSNDFIRLSADRADTLDTASPSLIAALSRAVDAIRVPVHEYLAAVPTRLLVRMVWGRGIDLRSMVAFLRTERLPWMAWTLENLAAGATHALSHSTTPLTGLFLTFLSRPAAPGPQFSVDDRSAIARVHYSTQGAA